MRFHQSVLRALTLAPFFAIVWTQLLIQLTFLHFVILNFTSFSNVFCSFPMPSSSSYIYQCYLLYLSDSLLFLKHLEKTDSLLLEHSKFFLISLQCFGNQLIQFANSTLNTLLLDLYSISYAFIQPYLFAILKFLVQSI